jgi:protein SCO1/2
MNATVGFRVVIALFAIVVFLSWRPARAADAPSEADPHAAHRTAAQPGETTFSQTRVALPDVTLLDSRGKPFRLWPGAFDGKIVVVDFIFTRCTTICPALSTVMAAVQRGLGKRMGREVVLVSISVDPGNDTPDAMRAYAQRMRAGEDWLWLTGNAGDIARVLRAFGLSPGQPGDHPPLVLVGDPRHGHWSRWVGVPTPTALIGRVEEMAARTGASAAIAPAAHGQRAVSPPPEDPHAHHRPRN